MFSSRLDPVTGLPRVAEPADSKMDVERHDENYPQKRKKKQDETPDLHDPIEEGAEVATPALLSFLQGFLASLPQANAQDGSGEIFLSVSNAASAPASPVDPSAARAFQAYQTTARAVRDPNASAPPLANPDAAQALLGSEDIRTLYQLIDDVKVLLDRGIYRLPLEKAPTFLNSLVAATQKAKGSS